MRVLILAGIEIGIDIVGFLVYSSLLLSLALLVVKIFLALHAFNQHRQTHAGLAAVTHDKRGIENNLIEINPNAECNSHVE